MVPARWWLRLDALLRALGAPDSLARPHSVEAWAETLDQPERFEPIPPPAPCPPVEMRPRKLSVTQISTWMADPYAIYAREILRLRRLDPLDAEIGPADRGNLVHLVLDRFLSRYRTALPENAKTLLAAFAEDMLLQASAARPSVWAYWRPRLGRIAEWFIGEERRRRLSARPLATEIKGQMTLAGPEGAFLLTAKADRIDLLADGRLAIIDYKTGSVPSQKDVERGLSPQLPLEAVIAQAGGFENVPAGDVGELAYWRMTGGREAGNVQRVAEGTKAADLATEARDGLIGLIALFDDPSTAYEPVPWPERAPRYSDYRHLARIAEWSQAEEPG